MRQPAQENNSLPSQPYRLLMTVSAASLEDLETALLDAIDDLRIIHMPISVGTRCRHYNFDLDVEVNRSMPHLSTAEIYHALNYYADAENYARVREDNREGMRQAVQILYKDERNA